MVLHAGREVVLVSGCPPIRAKKPRYYEDPRFRERLLPPATVDRAAGHLYLPDDDWIRLPLPAVSIANERFVQEQKNDGIDDSADAGIRREPQLPKHEGVAQEGGSRKAEFDLADEEPDDDVQRVRVLRAQAANVARQAAMDSANGLDL